MKKLLNLKLNEGTVRLRLTVGGQKRLKARFQENTLQVILMAIDDLDVMTALLDEALSWEGSGNAITDGEALYDLLVDNGFAGPVDFGGLALDIAACSGLLSEEQAGRIKGSIAKTMEGVLDGYDAGEEEHPTIPGRS